MSGRVFKKLENHATQYYNTECGGGMRIFLTRGVARFVRAEGISVQRLVDAIARAERGLIDAELGGGLIKQRVARPGQGKSSGWRMLIAYRRGRRSVFVLGFAKNDLDNIDPRQLADFKALAADFLTASEAAIAAELKRETLKEVPYAEKD
jgi:hypothetical protein